MLFRIGMTLVLLPALVAAQAIVEHSLGSAAGATGAAGAGSAGKSIGAVFEKLGKTLQDADTGKSSTQEVTATPARRAKAATVESRTMPAAEPTVPPITYEDPAGIKPGMQYTEILSRFGPPAMKLTTGPGEETLSYATKSRSLDIQMREGKVASIQKTIASNDPGMIRIH